MWQPIHSLSDVPIDRDLRLAVLKGEEVHALVFPCRRRRDSGWMSKPDGSSMSIRPTGGHGRKLQLKDTFEKKGPVGLNAAMD